MTTTTVAGSGTRDWLGLSDLHLRRCHCAHNANCRSCIRCTCEDRQERAKSRFRRLEWRPLDNIVRRLSVFSVQRVAIAPALVNNPSIRRPTSQPGTRLENRPEIHGAFERLHKAGNTIVLVTHETKRGGVRYRAIHIRDGQVENDVRRAA